MAGPTTVAVACLYDHEEIGSRTAQGAPGRILIPGEPETEAEGDGKGFTYVATFEVMPEVQLEGLDKIKVEKPEVEIGDGDAGQALGVRIGDRDVVVAEDADVALHRDRAASRVDGGVGRQLELALDRAVMLSTRGVLALLVRTELLTSGTTIMSAPAYIR